MAEAEDPNDKPHEASARKLERAREKGEIPRSQDLNTAMSYLGFLLAFLLAGTEAIDLSGDALRGFLDQAATTPMRAIGPQVRQAVQLIAALVALPAALVLLSLIARRAIVFAPNKLAPKINRISVLQNAKSKFGRQGWFEFFKSFSKLSLITALIGAVLYQRRAEMFTLLDTPAPLIALHLGTICLQVLAWVFGIALCFGLIDTLWQGAEHRRKNRMSQKEVKDEHKDSEGDPTMKAHRRAKAQDIALNAMIQEVPKADVVIVNPTHFAVALKWDLSVAGAPICVAKGVDHAALRIRDCAEQAGVPIRSDPPTARALHASLSIGDQVRPEQYAPVAAAIRFAEAMRQKAKHR
jgi:flagellar biosynthetic protein FlhB